MDNVIARCRRLRLGDDPPRMGARRWVICQTPRMVGAHHV